MSTTKTEKRIRRHKKIRATVKGTAERPRLAVFKSNRYLYAQLINDDLGTTLLAADSTKSTGKTFTDRAVATGTKIAELAKAKNIEAVVFDRGGFLYSGLIKTFADAARAGGLKF